MFSLCLLFDTEDTKWKRDLSLLNCSSVVPISNNCCESLAAPRGSGPLGRHCSVWLAIQPQPKLTPASSFLPLCLSAIENILRKHKRCRMLEQANGSFMPQLLQCAGVAGRLPAAAAQYNLPQLKRTREQSCCAPAFAVFNTNSCLIQNELQIYSAAPHDSAW